VIHATERGTPDGREPIRWKIVTNLPVACKADAIEKLDGTEVEVDIGLVDAPMISPSFGVGAALGPSKLPSSRVRAIAVMLTMSLILPKTKPSKGRKFNLQVPDRPSPVKGWVSFPVVWPIPA